MTGPHTLACATDVVDALVAWPTAGLILGLVVFWPLRRLSRTVADKGMLRVSLGTWSMTLGSDETGTWRSFKPPGVVAEPEAPEPPSGSTGSSGSSGDGPGNAGRDDPDTPAAG